MSGLMTTVGSVLAIFAFLAATLWIFTPKRAPAKRSRRGWGAIFLFAASAGSIYFGGNFD